jgi:TolB-like protein
MAEDSPKSGEGNQAVQAEMPRQGAGSHDVFVSYASQDAALANAVVGTLEKQGVRCWIAPRDVVPGSLYADKIVGAINDAKVVVLVLSEHSVASPHVGKELERASSKRRRIVAFRTDSAPLTRGFEYFLSESQWIDVGTGGTDVAIAKLVEAVRRHLDPSAVMESHAHSDPPTVSPKGEVSRARWMAAAGVVVAVLTLAYFAVDKIWLSKRIAEEKPVAAAPPATVPAIPEKSVAVLPFVDMSEKKDQEYFSDGLSEELIDHLAHTTDLKVIARTSSFQFKGKNEDMRTIGLRLGVMNLLEGSVRTSGHAIRVTAQLINVHDGTHRWSETFDRQMGDIFKVQDEIAAAVVVALQATMEIVPSRRVLEGNIDSYNELLKGKYFRQRVTKTDSERAIAAFMRAIDLDATNATAWVQLGVVYNMRGLKGWMTPREALVAAREAANRALAIDPHSAAAHDLLGTLEWNYNYDLVAANVEYRRADELDPGGASRYLLGDAKEAMSQDQPDTAVKIMRKAVELDPLDSWTLGWLAHTLESANRLAEAEQVARQLLELNSGYAGAHCSLGEILLEEHNPDALWLS